ncbi:hypothetical protein EMIT0P74_120187 [Pseudomonas sp. IT-P74]
MSGDVSCWHFRLGDRNAHKAVATKYQDKKSDRTGCINIRPGRGPCRCSLQVPPRLFFHT